MKHRELESKKPNNFHSFCSFLSSSGSLTLPPPFQKSHRNLFSGEENLFLAVLLLGDTWHYYLCYQHLLPRSISMPLTFRLLALFSLTDCTGKIKSMSSSTAASPHRNTHSRGHCSSRLIPRTAGWFKSYWECSKGTENTSSFSKNLTRHQP